MSRRREGWLDILVKAPWPAGIAGGVIGFLAIRYGIGWFLTQFGGPVLAGTGRLLSSGALASLAWLVLGVCWLASGIAWRLSARRAALLERQRAPEMQATPLAAIESDVAAFRPVEKPACPRCGAAMIERFSRTTKQAFLGCSAYPGCRGTRALQP